MHYRHYFENFWYYMNKDKTIVSNKRNRMRSLASQDPTNSLPSATFTINLANQPPQKIVNHYFSSPPSSFFFPLPLLRRQSRLQDGRGDCPTVTNPCVFLLVFCHVPSSYYTMFSAWELPLDVDFNSRLQLKRGKWDT